jgi:hypothetical protein
MPNLDQTGPAGQGSGTGRKMGKCCGNQNANSGRGRGMKNGNGNGAGNGRGMGRGRANNPSTNV